VLGFAEAKEIFSEFVRDGLEMYMNLSLQLRKRTGKSNFLIFCTNLCHLLDDLQALLLLLNNSKCF